MAAGACLIATTCLRPAAHASQQREAQYQRLHAEVNQRIYSIQQERERSDGNARRVTVFLSLSPVTAAVLGVTLLGEPVTLGMMAGVVCVAAGLWVANREG
jgi:uncharacterized membrane protein